MTSRGRFSTVIGIGKSRYNPLSIIGGKVICVPVALPASTFANTPKIPPAERIREEEE